MELLQDIRLSGLGAALLRFILAGFWIAHWWYKVGYRGMPATQAFFSQHGLPVWLAWFDVGFEVVVALCLVLGVYVPLLCLISLPILFASMWIYRRNGFYFRPEVSSFRCYGRARKLPRLCSVQGLSAYQLASGWRSSQPRLVSGSNSGREAQQAG